MRRKTLKKFITLPCKQRFFLWLVCSLSLTLLLTVGSLIESIEFHIKQHNFRYYTSHAQVYTKLFRNYDIYNITTWWKNQNHNIEQLKIQEFTRGVTRRSKIPALYKGKESYPLCLIITESNDASVFSPFMMVRNTQSTIPEGFIYISEDIAEKYNLKLDDPFEIYIPSLNAVLTNLKIGNIYPSPDTFHQRFSAFVGQNSLTEILSRTMQSYHIRFYASPFYQIQISNMIPQIPNSHIKPGDDNILYPLSMLSAYRQKIRDIILLIYMLFGMIIFTFSYQHYSHMQNILHAYCFRLGIKTPNLSISLFSDGVKTIILCSLTAIIVYGLLVSAKVTIPLNIFYNHFGLYPQFNINIRQSILMFDIEFTFWTVLSGVVIFTLVFIADFYGHQIIHSISLSHNHLGYTIGGMIIVVLLGFLNGNDYLYASYAKKGRDNQWKNYYFGDWQLYPEGQLGYTALNLPLKHFIFDFNSLTNKKYQYIALLQTSGRVIVPVANNHEMTNTNTSHINIFGIRGNYFDTFDDVLQYSGNYQLTIGKNIADIFPDTQILSLEIYSDRNTVNITMPINHIKDFEDDYLNNSVFINLDVLNQHMNFPKNTISKILFSSIPRKKLTIFTNQKIKLNHFSDQKKHWSLMEDFLFKLIEIKLFVCTFIIFFIIKDIFFFIVCRNKKTFLYYYLWGQKQRYTYKYFYWYFTVAYLSGIFLAGIKNIYYTLIETNLPQYLILPGFTVLKQQFSIDVGAFFTGYSMIIFVSILVCGILKLPLYSELHHLASNPTALNTESRSF